MPEYLAPGVYVEEVSFRSKSISGVSTSTAAFVGPTRTGPAVKAGDANPLTPELLTSFVDFQRIYGGFDDLVFGGNAVTNFMAHGVQAFFVNGGTRLYVARVTHSDASLASAEATPVYASADAIPKKAVFTARFASALWSGCQVVVRQVAHAVPAVSPDAPVGSVVRVKVSGVGGDTFVIWFESAGGWKRRVADHSLEEVPAADLATAVEASLLTVMVEVNAGAQQISFGSLSPSEESPRFIGRVLAVSPDQRADAISQPIALKVDAGLSLDPDQWLTALVGAQPAPRADGVYTEPIKTFFLTGGSDGSLPRKEDYEAGFELLRNLGDISIVAAPGYSARGDSEDIQNALIAHVEGARYRFAVLDSPPSQTPAQVQGVRGKIDSTRAALYYPWITIGNPLAGASSPAPVEIDVPPSGAMCGIYARNDIERGVWKAPANEEVRGALRFERSVNEAEQEVLNPLGVNCLRYFPGRGYLVWGARTVSDDPEWKYVNVRRYFNYLEASIDKGTQWAVFEPNGAQLWARVRSTIEEFLRAEWLTGALQGAKTEEAFFVDCDQTTMTQDDLDNGRLVCLVGVAPIKPAEFIIFRIGQKTASAT